MFRAGKAASRFRLLQARINHNNLTTQQIRFNSTESVDVASKYSSVESLFKEEGIMLEDEAVQTAFEASTKFGDYRVVLLKCLIQGKKIAGLAFFRFISRHFVSFLSKRGCKF